MPNKHHILVVEDELELAKSTLGFLSENGYIATHAPDLRSARECLQQEQFSAVFLDLGLPDGDGMSLVEEIKNTNQNIGLIIVSAKDVVSKKVEGLELGADDYLTKPFFFPELNARLKSVIRRLSIEVSQDVVLNEITLIPEQLKALVHDKVLELTAKEFELLLYFILNQNRVISKTTLGEFLSAKYVDMGYSNDMVYTHIKNLKKKLVASGCTDYIKNIYGVGYKFTVE